MYGLQNFFLMDIWDIKIFSPFQMQNIIKFISNYYLGTYYF
jgi:hypothetical protein